MNWFRFYAEAVHDPKVQRLHGDVFKAWVNCLCLAAAGDGTLPSDQDVAFALRLDESSTTVLLDHLGKVGLLDQDEAGRRVPHNWGKRQYRSDSSTPRVRKHRATARNGNEKQPETFHDRSRNAPRAEQIQIRSEAEQRQSRADGDFRAWVAAYSDVFGAAPQGKELTRLQSRFRETPETPIGALRWAFQEVSGRDDVGSRVQLAFSLVADAPVEVTLPPRHPPGQPRRAPHVEPAPPRPDPILLQGRSVNGHGAARPA